MPQQDAAGSSRGAEEPAGLTSAQQAPHTDNTLPQWPWRDSGGTCEGGTLGTGGARTATITGPLGWGL